MSASTLQAGVDRGRMRSILPRLRPESTTDVARPVAQHPLEEVRRRRGPRAPSVVGLAARWLNAAIALEVVDEVGAERRVDVDARRDAGVHLLLHEGGVEMAGIEGHQADIGHGRRVLLGCLARHPAPAPDLRRWRAARQDRGWQGAGWTSCASRASLSPAGAESATERLSMPKAALTGYNVCFAAREIPALTGSTDDFSQWCVDAVRLEDPLRGRHHHVPGRAGVTA